MKKGLLFIVLIFITINGLAQRDYRKGYIITHEMDTIYGWVDYRGDIRNAKICSFKKNDTDKAMEYTPETITAYRFLDGKYYVSKSVDNEDVPKQVFLEYLVNGMASVYYYRDDFTNHHYYLEKDETFIELKEEKKEISDGHGTVYKTVKPYIGMLKATLNVYEMSDEIEKSGLDRPSLINIAKDYHSYACTDGSECIVYEKPKPPVLFRIGPLVGIDYSRFIMSGWWYSKKQYEFQTSAQWGYGLNWSCGVNMNLSLPQWNDKFFLQMQLLYTRHDYSGIVKTYSTTVDAYIRHCNIFQMDLAIKYEYPTGRFRPTIALGAVGMYLPNGVMEESTDEEGYLRPLLFSTSSYDLPMKMLYGFGFTPGVHYYLSKKIVLFIQLQCKYVHRKSSAATPAVTIQSYGLSTGVYF